MLGRINLPPQLSRLRFEYKTRQSRFQRWLSHAVQTRNLRPFNDPSANDPSGAGTPSEAQPAASEPSNSKTRGKAKGKGKGKGKGIKGRTKPDQPSNGPSIPLKLSVSQLKQLAVTLAASAKERVPQEVLDLLASIIARRKTVAEHYARVHSLPGVLAGNATHQHMIDVLEEIRSLLAKCGLPFGQLVKRAANGPFMAADGLTDDQGASPADPNDFLPEQLRKLLPAASGPSLASRPLSDFELIEPSFVHIGANEDDTDVYEVAEEGGAGEDLAMAAFCFLADAEQLSDYVANVWKAYAASEVSLASAAIVTSQAVQFVKDMEVDLQREYGTKLGSQYEDLVRAMLGVEGCTRKEMLGLVELIDDDTQNFLRAMPFIALTRFTEVISPQHAPLPRSDFFKPFVPSNPRSRMDSDERKAEDFGLLMRHLGEVATIIKYSDDGALFCNDALFRDSRPYVLKPSHPIPPHLVFQWDLWLKSVQACRTDLDRTARSAIATTEAIISSTNLWSRSNPPYDPWMMAGIRQETRAIFIDQLAWQIKPTTPGSKVLKKAYATTPDGKEHSEHLSSYQELLMSPWASGMLQARSLLRATANGIAVVGASGHLAAMLQLYHALRLYDKVEPLAIVDFFLRLTTPTMFPQGLPSKGRLALANWISLGGDPEYLRDPQRRGPGWKGEGDGLGVLPHPWGDSVVGPLIEDHKYRLTDATAKALAKQTNLGIEPSRRAKPGEQPDAFIALAQLKAQCEEEFRHGVSAIDFFAVERVGLAVFKRWNELAHPLFVSEIGEGYQEHDSQRVLMVGYVFSALDCQHRKDKDSKLSPAATQKIFDFGRQAFEEVRQNVMSQIQDESSLRHPL